MRTYSTEQQHHALRIASSRELNSTEATALIRGVEAYRDAEIEIAQLRADLTTVTAERAAFLQQLHTEEHKHLETREALDAVTAERASVAKQCDTWMVENADLKRRMGNLAASHDYPRIQDVVRIDALEQALATERAAHEETKAELAIAWEDDPALESTRTQLAAAEARVKEVERLCRDADDRGHADVDAADILEALRG